MTKVYPETIIPLHIPSQQKNPVALTVWKKSLLFGRDGFKVFDFNGNLVLRVDNYPAIGNREILLMDANGRTIHTIRRKMLSVADNFLVYDEETTMNPGFSVTKHMIVFNKKSLAYVSTLGSSMNRNKGNATYESKDHMLRNRAWYMITRASELLKFGFTTFDQCRYRYDPSHGH